MNKTIKVLRVLQGKANAIRTELALATPDSTHSMLLQIEAELLEARITELNNQMASQALEIFDLNTTTTYGEGLPF